jgi:signal transduction histidine kinase
MKTKSFLFVRNTWTQIFIIVIFCVFVTHLIAFYVFSRYTRDTELQINRGIIARQIITLIEAVEINPPNKQKIVVNAIDIPNITISLDHSPRYRLRVSRMEVWNVILKINEIPKTTRVIRLSIKFSDHKWLNISAVILQSSWNLQIFLFILELIIVLALIFMTWSFSRFNRPLKRFIQSVEHLGHNINQMKLSETDGPPMVRQAAVAINKMQSRIQTMIGERTQMMAAISHDLKTPITRLKLRAQFIEDKEQYKKIIHDLDEMEAMITTSLAYFKNETQIYKKTKIDLASLLVATCIDYQDTNHKLTYQGSKKNQTFYGDSPALKRAFNNVIDNALKYGGKAIVSFNKKRRYYVITVDDNGPGIPDEDLQKVFQPFYRGEQSRSRSTGGTGLGLAVSRNILHAHYGDVTLEANKDGGLRVTITLPITSKQKP